MDVTPHIERLRQYVEERDFAGYDPYDALNSPILRALSFGSKYGRIAWTQFMRRCPMDLRPCLGVPRGHNPKAIGLFLWGAARLYGVEKREEDLVRMDYLLALLESLRSSGYSGDCWGYNFDWQSRSAYRPKGTPTIVNSSFIGHALLDMYRSTGSERALDMALSIKRFIMDDIKRSSASGPFCFSYTPIDANFVHNANLLGASLLIRLHGLAPDDVVRDTALRALEYTMSCQHDDGSWFYAERPQQHWIDSFHTGFNLQSMRYFLKHQEAQQIQESYRKGVSYYTGAFFLQDGTPKYYHDRIYPIDIHAPAQAIAFLSEEGPEQIVEWCLSKMYDSKRGIFHYRKGRRLTNRIDYMRWSQAWMFHALVEYRRASIGAGKKDDGD